MTAIPYTGTPDQDAVVAQWYASLLDSGELWTTFAPDMAALSQFYVYFRKQGTLFFHLEPDGRPALCWWIEPVMSGVFFGLWVAPHRRASRVALGWYLDALAWVLDRWPVILGITRQERLLDDHVKLGYTCVGKIPGIWHGYDAWLLTLTKGGFDGRTWGRQNRQQRQHPEHRTAGSNLG